MAAKRRTIRSESEEQMANAGAWTAKGGTARDDMEMGNVELDIKGYAATVQVGRRGTRDKEECT